MGLLPVYELLSSKYHYPLATIVVNLAKLIPEQPALIPRDDDRQAHESGLNNLGVRCQRASNGGGGHGMSNSAKDSEKPCADLWGSLLHHPVVHITISGFPCALKLHGSLDDTFCSAKGNM
jgi:hypothetical protein